jgi:hypothetical protein
MAKADDWTAVARPAVMAARREWIAYMTGDVRTARGAPEKPRLMKTPVDGKGAKKPRAFWCGASLVAKLQAVRRSRTAVYAVAEGEAPVRRKGRGRDGLCLLSLPEKGSRGEEPPPPAQRGKNRPEIRAENHTTSNAPTPAAGFIKNSFDA